MVNCNEASEIDVGVEELGEAGYSVSLGLLPLELVGSLLAELRRRELGDELAPAKIGRGSVQMLGGIDRRAQSSWFKDQSAAERHFLAFAERIRLAINRRLMLGLFEFEAQFLLYPVGGFYRRHIDALRGERNRVVSMVAYLNEDWTREDGGALALWNSDGIGNPVVEVLPLAGTVVLMLSEHIPHEARVALRERRAIAGWYRVNSSSGDHVDFARSAMPLLSAD